MIKRVFGDSLWKRHKTFVRWNFLSSVLGGWKYTLSTDSLLCVMNFDSRLLSGSVSFISKDLIGQLGTCFYAYRRDSSEGDRCTLTYGLNINILLQCCIFLENSTPFLPSYFYLPIASTSNIIKNISMVGMGAVNTNVIREIANDRSSGDIIQSAELYSKIAAQNSTASSIGMAMGIATIVLIPSRTIRFLFVCPILSLSHYLAYKKSLTYIFRPCKNQKCCKSQY